MDIDPARAVLTAFHARGWLLATAESCTGGLIAATLTAIAGSSEVVDCGFVTYSNEAKTGMLGVPAALIAQHGAVSEAVAAAMAAGAIARSRAELTISVTGIAGPGGGAPGKPVGLVWFARARRSAATVTAHRIFEGDRQAVRDQSVQFGLTLLLEAAQPARV